jgi:cystathionine beta-lyase
VVSGTYNFDESHERRGTRSIKWSLGEEYGAWVDYPRPTGQAPHEAEVLPMWLADMDFPAAPPILSALQGLVDHGIFGYTGLDDEFFDTIDEWAQRRHGWTIEREWVATNTGVMPAINLLIQTCTDPGDGVIVQTPVFHPISHSVELNKRELLDNALVYDGTRYNMDLPDLAAKAASPGAKMMILCSPHNPVGRVWDVAELRAVVDVCTANDVLLVSDEIHGDLTYDWSNFVSAGSLTEYHDRLVVCTGASKAFNLPGLKMSLTIIPDAELRAAYQLTLRNQNEIFGVNLFATTAVVAAYRHGEPWLEALIDYLAANVEFVDAFLGERLPQIRLVRPDALYLLWIDCRPLGLTGAELDERLRAAGVRAEQGSTYGNEGEGFIRLTIACSRQLLAEAMERVEKALGDVSSQ